MADTLATALVSLCLGAFGWQLRTLRVGVATGNLTSPRCRAYLATGWLLLAGWITYLVLALAGGVG